MLSRLKKEINSLSKWEKVGLITLLCVSFVIKVYYAMHMPIQIDEAFTYRDFVNEGFVFTTTNYIVPNNHVFHNVLTILAVHLPFGLTMDLRLFPIIESTICIFLFYLLCKRILSAPTSLLVTAIFSMVFTVEYYSYSSRGYSLLLLFFIVCYYCVINIIQDGGDKKDIIIISLASVLGFYTMPSYLYPYVTINIFLLGLFIKRKNYKEIKRLVIWGIVTLALTFLLYSPIFLHVGFKAVSDNQFVHPTARKLVLQRLLPAFSGVYQVLFGLPYVYIAVILIFIISLFKKNNRKFTFLNLFIVLFTLVIPILHSIIAYPRVWIYIIVPVVISLGIVLDGFYRKVSVYANLLITCIVFAGLNVFYFKHVIEFDNVWFKAREAAYKLMSYKPRYVYFDTWLEFNLRYYAIIEKQNYDATCTYGDFRYDLKVVDKKPFDYYVLYSDVIIKPEDSLKVVYANDIISIYKKQ